MAHDVGDWVTPTLTVTPFDNTTATTVVIVDPSTGTETAPANGITLDGGNNWTGPAYELTVAGDWIERWTVTGTGRGKQRRIVQVAPDPVTVPSGQRVYATTTDLSHFVHGATPTGARRKLVRASARIDELLRCAVYDVDPVTLLPTDTKVKEAIRDATCAQVMWWEDTGDELGTGGFVQVSIRSVNLSRGDAKQAQQRYAPDAVSILQTAGVRILLPMMAG